MYIPICVLIRFLYIIVIILLTGYPSYTIYNHADFVRTVIYNEETAVAYLREKNLLDEPPNDVINFNKCGSVMQSKRRILIRLA